MRDGEPFSVGAMTVRRGKIVELNFFNDPTARQARPHDSGYLRPSTTELSRHLVAFIEGLC